MTHWTIDWISFFLSVARPLLVALPFDVDLLWRFDMNPVFKDKFDKFGSISGYAPNYGTTEELFWCDNFYIFCS